MTTNKSHSGVFSDSLAVVNIKRRPGECKKMEVETQEELEDIIQRAGNKLVVIDLWASWCGPCKVIGPAFDRLSREFKDGVIFVKVDVDEAEDIAEWIQIECMPTFAFFKHGKKVDMMSGANKDMLEKLVKKHM